MFDQNSVGYRFLTLKSTFAFALILGASLSIAQRSVYPADVLQAEAVFAVYQENELAAKDGLKGKRMKVKGTVIRVYEEPKTKAPVVLLSGGEGSPFGIAFRFNKKHRKVVGVLRIGDSATISGVATEFSSNVVLSSATLVGYNRH